MRDAIGGLVVGMVAVLRVEPGQRVLEVGTGTGCTAALLAELVGEGGRVVTVEIDEDRAAEARQRLTAAGCAGRVDVVVGDGRRGAAEHAPYDRVLAAVPVPVGRVPYAWVKQTRPGGIIVTPVREGPVVAFIVGANGVAFGRALPIGLTRVESTGEAVREAGDLRVTAIPPEAVLGMPSARWAVAVALPSCQFGLEPDGGAWLRDPTSGSWASVGPRGSCVARVRQSGIRRLWDEAEAAYRWWRERGEPGIAEWVWTIMPGRQTVALPGWGDVGMAGGAAGADRGWATAAG